MGSEKMPLGKYIDISHGYGFKGKYFSKETTEYILLTPGNFTNGGGFKIDKKKFYDGPVNNEYVLDAGDLLVTMTDLSKSGDTLGYPAIVPKNEDFIFLHNQRLGKIIIKKPNEIHKRYLFYLLCTYKYRHHVLSTATGSTVRHTSPTRIMNYEVSLPSFKEQKRIAHILGTLDDKIELNQRMNQTLEAIARAVFKSWFVDFDPVRAKMADETYPLPGEIMALFPDELVESELGMIPKGWEVGKLGDEFKVVMGQSPPGSSYNEEGKGIAFYQGRTDFGFRYPSERVFCTEPKRFAEPGDTLVSVRAPVGDINMAKEKCCIGRGVAAIRHQSGSSSYTYYSMLDLQRRFKIFESEGTVFGSIGKNDINSLSIIIPANELKYEFGNFAQPNDENILNNYLNNEELNNMRNLLLSFWFKD